MFSIIIPTYNERINIEILIPKIAETLNGHDYEIIVVDDSSPDGTAKAAENLADNFPIRVIVRPEKLGLASAVVEGFKVANGKYIGIIDADLQHPPEYITEFAHYVQNGHDIVIGSRYISGGRIEAWSIFRTIISRGAIMLSRPLTNVKDPVSGYFFMKREVIEEILFYPQGFKILLEILIKGKYNNIKEIPLVFKMRGNGDSKLNTHECLNYLKLLSHLYGYKLKGKIHGR